MANLVRVKDKFQITIPVALRESVAMHAGDYLEVSVVDGGIFLRPHNGAQAAGKPSILDFLREPRGAARSRKQIDEALAKDRNQWR